MCVRSVWGLLYNNKQLEDYRVFLTGDRQTKCLDGDRQSTSEDCVMFGAT
jgi:hypothetical protein